MSAAHLGTSGKPGWPNCKRDDGTYEHSPGRNVEGRAVRAGCVYQPRQQEWRAKRGDPRGGDYAPVDRPDVARSVESVDERRHHPVAAAITGEHDGGEESKDHKPTRPQ